MKTLTERTEPLIQPSDTGPGTVARYVRRTQDEEGQTIQRRFANVRLFRPQVFVEHEREVSGENLVFWVDAEALRFYETRTWSSGAWNIVQEDEPFLSDVGDEFTYTVGNEERVCTVASVSFLDRTNTIARIEARYYIISPFESDLYDEIFGTFLAPLRVISR